MNVDFSFLLLLRKMFVVVPIVGMFLWLLFRSFRLFMTASYTSHLYSMAHFQNF
jgi:hypothetical protein